MRSRWLVLVPLILVGGSLFVALGGLVVSALWNWLLPALFGWPRITFLQAVGLLALCRILFGGMGMHSGRPRSRRMAERREPVTPEERERIRRGFGRWLFGSSAGEGRGE